MRNGLVASEGASLGRYCLEAAIQSAHARRAFHGEADWPAIVQLYDALLQVTPALGAAVGRAAAVCSACGPADALIALDTLEAAHSDTVSNYQPYWAVRAHVLSELGDASAMACYHRAIGLSEDAAVRAYLQTRLNTCT